MGISSLIQEEKTLRDVSVVSEQLMGLLGQWGHRSWGLGRRVRRQLAPRVERGI